jgi:hypothetical protein
MKKLVLAAIASSLLIASVDLAAAGWYDAYGYYHCVWEWGYAGYACY